MSDTSTAITIVEKQLNTLEDKVRRGLASFMEVGSALQRIKETNGFRLRGFEDFNAYCEQTFGFSASNGYKMIAAAESAKKVEKAAGEKPRTAEAARVMSKVTHDPKLIEKVQEKLKKAGTSIAAATAEKLDEIVEAVRPKTKPMFPEAKKAPTGPAAPAVPTLSDTCPACHQQPLNYTREEDGWHCGFAACHALVMVGVISVSAKACPECNSAILNPAAEFCEVCGCILEVA